MGEHGKDQDLPAAGGAAGRYQQTYPELTAHEIDRLRRFGEIKHYARDEKLFEVGKVTAGIFVVLKGHVCISQRDGRGRVTPVVEQGPGHFLAEVGQLTGKAALVDGYAEEDVEVLAISPENLRRLMVTEAELGERIMRALILRRVNLIQSGTAGPVLIGPASSPNLIRLQGFLTRNGFPHHIVDPGTDPEAAELIARTAPSPSDLPLVICLDGTVMKNPTEVQLARALGMIKTPTTDILFDVAVVGAGPAGLATSVYGGSEGLSIVCLDTRAFGGQAGASARIENYFGFPTGISGMALTARAHLQAQKFGTEMVIPGDVKSLDCSRRDGSFSIVVNDGVKLYARAVVVATGARYRRPDLSRLAEFEWQLQLHLQVRQLQSRLPVWQLHVLPVRRKLQSQRQRWTRGLCASLPRVGGSAVLRRARRRRCIGLHHRRQHAAERSRRARGEYVLVLGR